MIGRRHLLVDARFVDEAWRLSGEFTPDAAVTKALQEFIAQRSQRRLLELVGVLEWDSQYDNKKERYRPTHPIRGK